MKIASHTSLLAPACKPLQKVLDAGWHPAITSGRILLAGGDGERIFSPASARQNSHTRSPGCQSAFKYCRPNDTPGQLIGRRLEALAELGVSRVLDLGQGYALAKMVQAFLPFVRAMQPMGFRTVLGLRSWISSK